MLALPSSVHGTARNMFTYHGTTQAVGDEQDIEMMGATLTGSRTNYAEGVQLTNWEPRYVGILSDSVTERILGNNQT